MPYERGLRIRYFLLSFVASFFVWAVLYLFLAVVVHPYTVDSANPVAAPLEDPYQPEPDTAITVLFMGMPSVNDSPGAYLLAHFDPAVGQVALTALPGNLQVQNNGTLESMAEVYAYGGVQYTRELLAKTLGITIDRHVRVTPESFLDCAGAIGSVEHLLPVSLSLLQDGTLLELGQGLQLLDGTKALLLLQHQYGSAEESLSALTSLAADIVEQRRDVVLSTLVDSIFERIINRIDSDISYTDYTDRKSAGEYFAKLPGPVTKVIRLTGSEQNGRYLIADTFIAELAQYFG